ncbi:YveK family protein [Streptomyces winkii]|uniref:YveK family protein n=1 Tax=Streptomyces winkii TaxID=3051178 RepID=UPI0028D1C70B|nr:hypothetical protein [Streptomyces sp. DSM 40971]
MSKAAQGSAKSPTAGGSARTKQSRREARSANSGAGDGGGSSAAPEVTKSAEQATTTRTEAVKTGTGPRDDSGKTDTTGTTSTTGTTGDATGAKTASTSDDATGPAESGTAGPPQGANAPKNTGTSQGAGPPQGTDAPRGGTGTPKSGTGTKTSALTRTTPLRANALAAGARPRAPRPEPAPATTRGSARRRLRAWLRRVPSWWPVPLCLVLGAGAGAAYSEATPAQYAAISYVVVSPSGGSEAAGALGYAQAYGKIATDPVILADAERRAHLRPGTIRDGIQASTSPDAPMVQITATSSNASQAAKNADAVAKALTHTAKTSVKRTGARLTVLSDAMAPATPVSPSATVAVSVGACAGGLIGGLVLLALPQSRRRTASAGAAPATHGAPTTAAATAPTATAADHVRTASANTDSRTEQER